MQEVYNILANIPYILLIAVMVMLFKAGFLDHGTGADHYRMAWNRIL